MPHQSDPRRGNARRLALWIGGAAVVVVALLVVVGLVVPPPDEAESARPAATSTPSAMASRTAAPAAPAAPSSSAPSRRAPTVNEIADRLADLYPLPNRRDNSGKWADIGVVGLVTTDAVSVYQWRDEALARKWAEAIGSEDKIRIGVYVLSFVGSEQQLTSQEARKRMAAEVRKMLGE